jgi:hypothetical protein
MTMKKRTKDTATSSKKISDFVYENGGGETHSELSNMKKCKSILLWWLQNEGVMPTISEFFGIMILMFFDDHAPPHFHARYGGDEVVIQINPVGVLRGRIPPRALSLVIEWAQKYQQNLIEEWNRAANNKKLHKIPPLD